LDKYRKGKLHRLLLVLLWALVAAGGLVLIGYGIYKRTVEGENNRTIQNERDFEMMNQDTLIVSGDMLYYVDLTKEKALCSYNLETQETTPFVQAQGSLLRTGAGIYYVTDSIVYRIQDGIATEVCFVPKEEEEFVAYCDGTMYWVVRESGLKSEEEAPYCPRRYLYAKAIENGGVSELLFETKNAIRDVVCVEQRIYVMTEDGIYVIEISSNEVKKLSDLYSLKCVSDGVRIVFEGHEENSADSLYEILPDGKIEKHITDYESEMALFQGKLYYEGGNCLKVYDLVGDAGKSNVVCELPPRRWYGMEVWEKGVFLRDYATNDIWFYDFESGVAECIIKQ